MKRRIEISERAFNTIMKEKLRLKKIKIRDGRRKKVIDNAYVVDRIIQKWQR